MTRVFRSGGQRRSRSTLLLNEQEREGMRAAGRFNAQLMDFVRPHVQPGISTEAIDKLVGEYTRDHGHTPATLGYLNYPKSTCTSVNEVVCHGIPSPNQVLKEGDIVNVDLTTIVNGWHGDQSETFMVGEVSDVARRLVQCTFDCLHLGIEAIGPHGRVNDIGRAIERHAHACGFSVVTEYQGHGIGRRFHQEPGIPHYAHPRYRKRIEPGMCFTIEPMINVGVHNTVLDGSDGWTVRTADGKLSAQFEHTVLMTETGPEILTQPPNGPHRGHRF